MSIKAPFNFVPLNDKVFYPDWANAISQDVPFEDGQSGTITLNITADSPIFVRNGSLSEDKKEENFSQWQESKDSKPKYFIPGSSVKGMLRSVLEILSFGKLGIYDDNRYAVRDLNNRDVYMNRIIRLDKNGNKSIRCGWLQKQADNSYQLYDHGEPAKVSFADLDDMFGTHMNSFFQQGGGYVASKEEQKSAQFKYDKFKKISTAKEIYGFSPKGNYGFEKSDTGKKGIVIFTGQPGLRTPPRGEAKGRGKGSEFIFWEQQLATYTIAPKMIKDFKFAYFDNDEKKQSIDWKYWKSKLAANEKIPIFFQIDPTTKQVAHFGLSYLYKLPYEHSVGQAVNNTQKDINPDALDLAECIFGCIEDDDKNGMMLKGRVHFGHASATKAVPDAEKSAVLNSPKASYYPLYIRQKISNTKISVYKTFMDKGVEISGRKRYPVRNTIQTNPAPLINGKRNTKVETQFVPLQTGAKFQCQIAYHNLRAAELGALLSAITFHNTQGCFHSLGMAKSLGYGKIKVEVENLSEERQKNYLIAFEQQMNAVQPNWANTDALKELVTMAFPQNNSGNAELSYMKLGMTNRVNDFTVAKSAKEALDNYSKLNGIIAKTITSLTAEAAPQSNEAAIIANLKKELNVKLKALLPSGQSENNKKINQAEQHNAIQKPTAKSAEGKNVDAKNVIAGTILSAEVLIIGKPHGTARLFLDNYAYPLETKLMGLKKVTVKVGDIIKVKVNSIKDGKINDVTIE